MSTSQYDVESDEEVVISLDSDEENGKETAMEIETPLSDVEEVFILNMLFFYKKNTDYFVQVVEDLDALFEAVQLNLWPINEVTFKNIKSCLDQQLRVIIIFYDSHQKIFRGYAKVVEVFKTEEIHKISHIYADVEWLGFGDVELKSLDNIIEGRLLNGMKIHEEEGKTITNEIDKNLDIQPQCFQNSFTNPTFYNSTCQTLFRSQSFSEYNTNNKSDVRVLQRSLSNIDIITDHNDEYEGISVPLLPPYDTINFPPPFTYQYIRYSSCVGRMNNNNNNLNNNIEKPMIVEENKYPSTTNISRNLLKEEEEEEETEVDRLLKSTDKDINKTNTIPSTESTTTIENKNISDSDKNMEEEEENINTNTNTNTTTDFLDDLLDHEEDFDFE